MDLRTTPPHEVSQRDHTSALRRGGRSVNRWSIVRMSSWIGRSMPCAELSAVRRCWFRAAWDQPL